MEGKSITCAELDLKGVVEVRPEETPRTGHAPH